MQPQHTHEASSKSMKTKILECLIGPPFSKIEDYDFKQEDQKPGNTENIPGKEALTVLCKKLLCPSGHKEEAKTTTVKWYFRGILRGHWLVILAWIAICGASAPYAFKLLSSTSLLFEAPSGSEVSIFNLQFIT